MKHKWLVIALIVTGIGTLLTGLFAPGVISWYFSPPVDLAVSCKPAVEWGIESYQKTLLYGTFGSFVIGALLGGWVSTRGPRAPSAT